MSEYTEYVYRRTREPWGWSAENTGEQIVRCRDCRFRAGDEADQDGIDPYLCFVHEEYMAPDYFCADGERRVEQ